MVLQGARLRGRTGAVAMSADRIELPARPRILVVALRRLGDVLLTTPLIRSLRRAWPDAAHRRAGICRHRRHSRRQSRSRRASSPCRRGRRAAQSLALAARLWRRYDLAVSTQSGDRPTFFACVAGRARVAPVEDRLQRRAQARRASPQRRASTWRASRRADAAARRCARHCARAGTGVARSPRAGRRLRGRRLCGDPCRADVSLQAMDRRRLARACRGAGRARA